MKVLFESFKIVSVFIGTVIGAGFASGQEVLQFYTSFGKFGLVGSFVTFICFIILSIPVTLLGQKLKATSHKEVIEGFCGPAVGKVIDIILTAFLFAFVIVMIAGGGSLFHQLFSLPNYYGSLIVTFVTIVIVCLPSQQVLNIISSFTPLLTFLVMAVCMYVFITSHPGVNQSSTSVGQFPKAAGNWVNSSLLYVSFVIFGGAPALAITGGHATSRKSALIGGAMAGGVFGLMLMILAFAMYYRAPDLIHVEIPTLWLAREASTTFGVIMAIAIMVKLVITSVSMLFSFSIRLAPATTIKFKVITVAAGALACLMSFMGFVKLVGIVYPFFGYLGFIFIFCILFKMYKTRSQTSRQIA